MIQSKLCIVPFNTLADGDPKFHFIIIHLFFIKKNVDSVPFVLLGDYKTQSRTHACAVAIYSLFRVACSFVALPHLNVYETCFVGTLSEGAWWWVDVSLTASPLSLAAILSQVDA